MREAGTDPWYDKTSKMYTMCSALSHGRNYWFVSFSTSLLPFPSLSPLLYLSELLILFPDVPDVVKRCKCGNLIKPDIIFFGQSLRRESTGNANKVCTTEGEERGNTNVWRESMRLSWFSFLQVANITSSHSFLISLANAIVVVIGSSLEVAPACHYVNYVCTKPPVITLSCWIPGPTTYLGFDNQQAHIKIFEYVVGPGVIFFIQ